MTLPSDKALGWEALLERRQRARREGQTVVWTNGCFDLLHAGHVRSLQAARRLGDLLVVGVNGDASVRALKGPGRPVLAAAERLEVLAALECVSHVTVFEELTPEAALLRLRPDIHCKGADYAPPHGKPVPEAEVVRSYGGRIEYLPFVPGLSTSELIRRIRDQGGDAHGGRA
jgi:rfaE bifunctional protein nucleotidyltransferase chain/domain